MVIFHSYVSLPEGNHALKPARLEVLWQSKAISIRDFQGPFVMKSGCNVSKNCLVDWLLEGVLLPGLLIVIAVKALYQLFLCL